MTTNIQDLTGYRRDDGRVGFRNHVVVVPLAGCVQEIVNRIAVGIDGAVAFTQPLGCDLIGPDAERLETVLLQLCTNPNVGGVLFVTLGCAAVNAFRLPQRVADSGRLTKQLNFQQEGGTSACVDKGRNQARAMVAELAARSREPVPCSSIVLGTKCGASDKTSFTICHPILGHACDRLVDLGATVVLSEDFELLAGIDALKERAANAAVAEKLQTVADRLRARMRTRGGPGIEPELEANPERRKASLAHMAKAGTRSSQHSSGSQTENEVGVNNSAMAKCSYRWTGSRSEPRPAPITHSGAGCRRAVRNLPHNSPEDLHESACILSRRW